MNHPRPDRDIALDCLDRLSPARAADRMDWVRVGAALKSVSNDLYGDYIRWSSQAHNFDEKKCRANWKSAKDKKGGVTLGTLIDWASKDSGISTRELRYGTTAAITRPARQTPVIAPPTETPKVERDWNDIDRNACLHPACVDRRNELTERLGLSGYSLMRMGMGWIDANTLRERLDTKCKGRGCWTFPMRDASERIVGVRLRTEDNFKYAIDSSTAGLFIPAGERSSATLTIVEGPTDTAAALDMGLDAIGRPSNTGGADDIRRWLATRGRDISDVIIIIDRDQPDSDVATNALDHCLNLNIRPVQFDDAVEGWGMSAAESGTVRSAIGLMWMLRSHRRSVRIIAPPLGVKDVRDWRKQGATADDVVERADLALVFRAGRHEWIGKAVA